MANNPTDKCKRLRTALALESGNIQGHAEKMIAESADYLTRIIPDGTYETGIGTDSYHVRSGVPPIPETAYWDPRGDPSIVTDGATMQVRGPDGLPRDVVVNVNGIGALGCAPPSNPIGAMGFDTFTRDLRQNKWRIGPFCAWDMIDFGDAEIAALQKALREDWPRMLRDNFEYELRRRIISGNQFNYTTVAGMPYSSGGFVSAPNGQLDLGMVRRILNGPMKHHGWVGEAEISVSQTAFETMRLNYKNLMGLELGSSLDSSETHYVDGQTRIRWGGITWVINPEPMRGYFVAAPSGGTTFIPIYPKTYREGTGGGLVPDYNTGYDDPFVWISGARYRVYEVTMAVNPKAFTRLAMAMPSVLGRGWDNNKFNFAVEVLDRNNGGLVDCNEDNMKWQYLINHVYGWQPLNPELSFAIVHEVAPNVVNIVSVTTRFPDASYTEIPGSSASTVEIAEPGPSETSDCAIQEFATCTYPIESDDLVPNVLEPLPDGIPDLDADGNYLFPAGATMNAANNSVLAVPVQRVGGSDGAFSVTITPTAGTATAGSDYTAGATVLTWGDNEAGTKYVLVPILAGGTPGQTFTMVASGVETAVDGVTAVTVTIL